MSHVQTITSLDDPRIACYRNVKDGDLARQGGRFIAEGPWVVARLLASSVAAESVLVAQRKAEQVMALAPANVPVYVAADALVHEIVGFKFHSGVMACGLRPEGPTLPTVMAGCLAKAQTQATPGVNSGAEESGPSTTQVRLWKAATNPGTGGNPGARLTLLICPDMINTQNLGALIRSAAALGADALILGERCCDPFFRQSVRVSMGAVFVLPIVRSVDLLVDLRQLREHWNVELAATVLDPAAETLAHARRGERLALLLGSEDRGLGEPWLSACSRRITLPMRGGTDSLNVAAAAAVFLYHFTRL